MPAADTHADQAIHARMQDMSQGELRYMLEQHLIWNDIPGDEFLSYSNDPLFLVVHALNRYHEYQGDVTIQYLDRRKARNIEDEQAAFYPALKLYETLDVPSWCGCSKYIGTKLRSRKFTQEYLSHGTLTVNDARFQQASIKTLIRDGLYEIKPELQIPDDHKHNGLYTRQVVLRMLGYPPTTEESYERIYSYTNCAKSKPFTVDLLKTVQQVTRNFMNIPASEDRDTYERHLHIFLHFLTFDKRPRRDPAFIEWIRTHYKGKTDQIMIF